MVSASDHSLNNAQSAYHHWTGPAGAVRVELSRRVMGELGNAVAAVAAGAPDRGREVGGVLLGRLGDPVRIEAFEAVTCEYRRGLSFTLSPKDRRALATRVEKRRDGLEVVGFYRSHTRPGLFLDEDDYALMKAHFGDPRQVALLMKPWAERGLIAGFFVWEGGEMNRRAPYSQFGIEGPAVAAAAQTAHDVQPVAVEAAPRAPVQAAATAPSASRSRSPLRAHLRLPARRYWREIAAGTAALAGVGVLIGGTVALLERGAWQRPQEKHSDVEMVVTRIGDGFRVNWNRASATLAKAGGAVLWIDDGGRRRRLDLNADEVRTGSVTYYPTTESVTIRMEPASPQNAAAAPAPPLPGPVDVAPPSEPQPRIAKARKAPPRPFRMQPVSAVRHQDGADRQVLAPPPVVQAVSGTRFVPQVSRRNRPPALLAKVTCEPVRPHVLSKVVGKIPGLRALKRNRGRDSADFTAPEPVKTFAPQVPPDLGSVDAELDVKVSIDKLGKVTTMEVLSSREDERLERLAVAAAERWEFTPARLKDKAVESEMLLRFNFRPLGRSERASVD